MKYLFIILFCFCAVSCSFLQPQEEHMPAEKMRKVLADMHMAEVYSTITGRDSTHKNQERNMDSLAHYYKEILAHYSITPEDFNKSADWYRANPDMLDSVYNDMLSRVTAMQKK
jgi:Domain of unknown function (DUF4296)